MSNTDKYLDSMTNAYSQNMRVNLGIFVLLTSIFAFISGYYALMMIFGDWDPLRNTYHLSGKMQVVCLLVAFFYAMMILMIDKMIVSDTNKFIVILRIPLAILLGLVIAVPLKLKILENEINKEIYRNQVQPVAAYNAARDEIRQEYAVMNNDLEMIVQFHLMKVDSARLRKNAELAGIEGNTLSGRPGRGLLFRIAAEEEREQLKRVEELKARIETNTLERDARLTELEQNLEQTRVDESYGLWARYMTMGTIIENDSTGKAGVLVWGITILFVLFELLPSLMKLMGRKTEYDMLLDFTHKQFRKKLDHFSLNGHGNILVERENIHIPKTRYASQETH